MSKRDYSMQEADFLIQDLFFSRTDQRGVIKSGNDTFRRISEYSWNDLLNKPHNIIRHPDMPRAVFWLLWNTIKQNKPIGAYVKNRSQNGKFYWVFAIVTPYEGGYLSVRLKPTSHLLPSIKTLYKQIREKELQENLSPEASAELLLAQLPALGFPHYESFMSIAAIQEIQAREKELSLKGNPAVSFYLNIRHAAEKLMQETEKVTHYYFKNQHVPFNLRIQAAQLGSGGAMIDVISSNYSVLSEEMRSIVNDFYVNSEKVFSKINDGLMLTCISDMQQIVIEAFTKEHNFPPEVNKDKEMSFLQAQQKHYQHTAKKQLEEIILSASSFIDRCREMERLCAGLEVTRIMGKVESARLDTTQTGLDELIYDLEVFQADLQECLKNLDRYNHEINFGARKISSLWA